MKLRATEPVQEIYDRVSVVGPCAESGLRAKPALQARVTVYRNGQQMYVLVVPEGQRLATPDGVTVELLPDGVVTLKAQMTFRWQSQPYEVAHSDDGKGPEKREGEAMGPTLGRPPLAGRPSIFLS